MVPKRWILARQYPLDYLSRYRLNPILAQVLVNRGYETPDAAHRFLYAKADIDSPFGLTGMPKAVGRIREAIKRRENIVVYGDFDADGVTSTALLVEALRRLGAQVRPYIPHRVDEGYGVNVTALEQLRNAGARLVITVDCGIRSVEEIEHGKSIGLDIIVTDHHSLGPEIPDAYAVINPQQEDQPLMLAGVGVAYMLARALCMAAQNNGRRHNSTNFDPDELLDLVAIGTVADLMPLNRLENRVLVRRGLEVLRQSQRPGVRALLDVIDTVPADVTAATIGFGIGPRLNAAGRLDHAMIAYDLLTARNEREAKQKAAELQDLNTQRQAFTREAQEVVKEHLVNDTGEIPLIFAADESFRPGIVGLVAGRLAEEYFRPAVVVQEGEIESHASCRSIPQFNITTALDKCADLLVRHGGHALAAGFTVLNENIPALRAKLIDLASRDLRDEKLVPELEIDADIDVHKLSEDLVNDFALLEPCGNGNRMPVLMTRNVHVAEARTVGRDNKHLKLKISRASRPPLDAIGFGLGDWVKDKEIPQRIDIAYNLEINEWNGRQYLQANLQDIRPAETG